MALAVSTTAPDRAPSPNRLPLSSNNPFRNRAASPQSATFPPNNINRPSPASATMSKNPFLDASEMTTSPTKDSHGTSGSGLPADIFKDLSLLDTAPSNGASVIKNGPSQRAGTLPPSGHRPMASEEQQRRDRAARQPRAPDSPPKREHKPRPRGMSESSAMDERERRERRDRERGERPERTESEERRRRERRKEREERHRREKERVRKGDGRPAKKQAGLDIIDKLDVTGIYGQGLFHHDGPFDACNPHRNAAKSRRPAPMQAFPADSANMALGGSGPVRSRLDLDKFHGRGEEGFSEFAATRKADTAPTILHPTDRIEQVHGDESYGLGTSTFLEGAPASKSALQRRESEDQGMMQTMGTIQEGGNGGMGGAGLARKKSLVQRFRGMSASRRGGDMRSPDARYNVVGGNGGGNGDALETSPPSRAQQTRAISAGGPARARFTKENEVNPFFDTNEYDSAFDKKGAQIRVAEQAGPMKPAYPGGRAWESGAGAAGGSSPKGYGLVRSVTADSGAAAGGAQGRGSSNEEERAGAAAKNGGGGGGMGGGILNRMRSLKGGRRARPERRDT